MTVLILFFSVLIITRLAWVVVAQKRRIAALELVITQDGTGQTPDAVLMDFLERETREMRKDSLSSNRWQVSTRTGATLATESLRKTARELMVMEESRKLVGTR